MSSVGVSQRRERQFDTTMWFNWEQPAVPLLLDLTFEACGRPFSDAFGLPVFTSVLYYREDPDSGQPRGSWLLRTDEGIALGRLLVDGLHIAAAADRVEDEFAIACSTLLERAAELESSESDGTEEALQKLDRFRSAFLRFYGLGAITEPVQWYAEWSLERILGSEQAELRTHLFAMEEEPHIFVVERELLRLAVESRRGQGVDDGIAEHAERYFWKANNYAQIRRLGSAEVRSEVEELAAGDPESRLEELEAERRAALARKAEAMAAAPAKARRLSEIADRFGSTMADRRKAVMNRSLAGLDAAARRLADAADADYRDVEMLGPRELRTLVRDPARIVEEAEQRRGAYVQTLAPYSLDAEEMAVALEFAEETVVIPRAIAGGVAAGANAERLLDEIDLRMGLFSGQEADGVVRGDVVQIPGWDGVRVAGRCRVVSDPFRQRDEFEEGEILLASSTTPDFVPIMRKALAVVTNMGGMLQHAAHFAREERKPCVVGTGFATSAFSSGDEIEIDLRSGEVSLVAAGVDG